MPRSAPPPDWVLDRRRRVGDQIRAARLSKNLTQETVAHAIPMDRASYNRIEQGHAAATIDTLHRIAYVLDIPLAELVR